MCSSTGNCARRASTSIPAPYARAAPRSVVGPQRPQTGQGAGRPGRRAAPRACPARRGSRPRAARCRRPTPTSAGRTGTRRRTRCRCSSRSRRRTRTRRSRGAAAGTGTRAIARSRRASRSSPRRRAIRSRNTAGASPRRRARTGCSPRTRATRSPRRRATRISRSCSSERRAARIWPATVRWPATGARNAVRSGDGGSTASGAAWAAAGSGEQRCGGARGTDGAQSHATVGGHLGPRCSARRCRHTGCRRRAGRERSGSGDATSGRPPERRTR